MTISYEILVGNKNRGYKVFTAIPSIHLVLCKAKRESRNMLRVGVVKKLFPVVSISAKKAVFFRYGIIIEIHYDLQRIKEDGGMYRSARTIMFDAYQPLTIAPFSFF